MDLKNIDWAELDFSYKNLPYRFRAYWKDGKWDEGKLVTDNNIVLNESAPCLHYGQQCFEGLKAQRSKDGRIWLFRPYENAKRFQDSAKRLMMPEVPVDLFMKGVIDTVKANADYVPPYGYGASMYIRPLLIGIGENLGVRPASEYIFSVFVCPVGPYYKYGFKTISLKVDTNFDRAAPNGVGHVKVGGNYAASLLPLKLAKNDGFDEVLYLDSKEHQYIEETGSSNVFFIFEGKRLITPKSNSILPSITRKSVVQIAKEEFGFEIEERKIHISEIERVIEAGACGTAAVITPIGSIYYNEKWYKFYADGKEPGPTVKKLYEYLTSLQVGDVEDKWGWLVEVT